VDLALFFRVLWRFRIIVAAGILIAIALSSLSFVRVTFKGGTPHIAYRQQQTWQSQETFLITAHGVPWAKLNNADGVGQGGLAGLSAFYAQLANSDAVQALLRKSGPVDGSMVAAPAVDNVTSIRAPLPFVSIQGLAASQAKAVDIARRGAEAFRTYVIDQQNSASIPPDNRVEIQVLSSAKKAVLLQGRKKTLPIVILMTILIATVGLAFILENLRPRVRPLQAESTADLVANRHTA
jgi:hypothetical protein